MLKRSSVLITLGFITLIFSLSTCSDGAPHKTTINYVDQEKALLRGQELAQLTFQNLSMALQNSLNDGGLPSAIPYCNLHASSLTDSLSRVHDATIKRTSNRIRNPLNTPTKDESLILKQYEQKMTNAEALSPTVELDTSMDRWHFFAPIKVNSFCLQCHGDIGTDIYEADYQLIKAKYPNDMAIGYQAGDLRGIWSISFPQKQEQK